MWNDKFIGFGKELSRKRRRTLGKAKFQINVSTAIAVLT
jgi:hypothetical protein